MAFGFLEQENYELAEIIFEILKKKQNGIDPLSKVYAQINYWQCLKRTNRITLMNEEMSSIDFSLYKEKIVIGIYALKDEHQKVYDCLQDLYPDEISLARLKSWPIFKEFRNTIWYKVFMIEKRVGKNLARSYTILGKHGWKAKKKINMHNFQKIKE